MATDQALLIIDVQKGMFLEGDQVYQGEALLATLQNLLAAAREQGVAVVYIQHGGPAGSPLEPGTDGWEVHPAIAPLPGDLVIRKCTPDSFHKTELQEALQARGIRRLYMTGIQSEACVDTTTRRAFSLGYDVTLVTDAHSTWPSDELTAQQIINHHNRALRWFAGTAPAAEIRFS